ncbi:hypothetical protein QCM80_22125 [Bradyrhizobium sp. SSUT112]|uniref:hypothetical protein n=1 Tax=Bradyrhizobium sp. SSUT112 TaxID=3040604 RepID=UPI00244CA784|nr:hypothetical protein [Bradyrhizobium sp. SSUT112]MDH2353335.1 hypothetical protein [Bradyrhizobium sp. SSUT112]
MAENDQLNIHFVSEAGRNDSPKLPLSPGIAHYLIEPALSSTPHAKLSFARFSGKDGSLDHYSIDMMASDDLVIADLTSLGDTAFFILGARAYKGLPIVYICDEAHPVPYDLRSDFLVRYAPDNFESSVQHLREEIERALAEANDRRGRLPSPPLPSREMRLELADRIETTAKVIRELRINSASESVAELEAIAAELKQRPDDNSQSRLQEAADKSIKVISALLDELSSQPGARMAITGALALIVGGTGASGAAAFGAGLAFWYGKDVFTKWITAWGKRNGPTQRSRKK